MLRCIRGTAYRTRAPDQRCCRLQRALLVAGHEPLLALRGRAVGEGVGTTRPVAWRCSVSSPIADAVVSAASMSPASRKFGRFFCSRLTQTPDEAVGLQLHPHLQRVGLGLAAGGLLLLASPAG